MNKDLLVRRRWVMRAAAGTTLATLGGMYAFADDRLAQKARETPRPDGRPKLPPGQRLLSSLKPMGGMPGPSARARFSLKVHGAVHQPYTLDFRELGKLGAVTKKADVHCVTGWSMLDGDWTGVLIKTLLEKAGPSKSARYVIFEAAHGYTANVRLKELLAMDAAMITWALNGRPLAKTHGAPARALVPDLYFWKSAKWITGIRVQSKDERGYWERRGYHNHADPWKEERHS